MSVDGVLSDVKPTSYIRQTRKRNKRQWSTMSTLEGDYVGCFALGCLHFDYFADEPGNRTTPYFCTAVCKENGFPFAGVYNRTKCPCFCVQTCLERVDDDRCGIPCLDNPVKFCGGYAAVSVYNMTVNVKSNSSCDDNTTLTDHDINSLPDVQAKVIFISLIVITFILVLVVVIARTRRWSIHCQVCPHRPLSEFTAAELAASHRGGHETSKFDPKPSTSRAHRTHQALPQPVTMDRYTTATGPGDTLQDVGHEYATTILYVQ
ncbi:uncharacterized protein LOC135156937 [Lytechinus pictus]|uniref:uncharacterized protein LOC135156937 n=1 Tax=Lytechinus pictus TaxID=7653 RepID=UPI0030B9E74D